jgi:sterol desaturase/sphingolipid hydroxylase (fatty acid hydroxylase superfamily)
MPDFSSWYHIASVIALRYFIIAGVAWLLFYVWLKKKWWYKKIQLKWPSNGHMLREIGYSVITTFIFSAVPYLLLATPIRQHTLYYNNASEYGWLWFWLAFPIMLVVHDAYFYFTHRLMHHRRLFKWFHLVHHKSVNPSPWAAFAFHPLEAIVEAGIVILFLFFMPICFYHLFFFFLFMMLYNVYGHLGWELYPPSFATSSIGKWINTSVNHNQHHQYFKGNYGLYFLWWDRWLSTIRKDYDAKYNEVKQRSKKGEVL